MHDFARELAFFREHPVTDWHEHAGIGLFPDNGDFSIVDRLMSSAANVGIDRMVISNPVTGGTHATPEQIAAANDYVGRCVRRYPGRLFGLAYVDPVHGRYAVAELDRCVKEYGFLGAKLYNQYTMDNDIQNPVIEYTVEHDLFILMHAGHICQIPREQPYISDSTHMAGAARKYPEAHLIMAHIGGGGDWNWQLRGLEDCPNVFCDISGSVHDTGMIEGLVRAIGAERVLFGTDGNFSSSIGKLCGAKLTEREKLTIMENPRFLRYLERGNL